MLVKQIMRVQVTTVGPNQSVRAAAALMLDRNIGALPVCTDGKPVGIVTDRDLAIRLLPNLGCFADRIIQSVMSQPVITCRADQDVVWAARLMGQHQVRRLAVCDDAGVLIGVLSLGDIARDASEELAGQALGETVEFR